MKNNLKRPYMKVKLEDKQISYGGSQRWFSNSRINGYGCGAVAAMDVTEYLTEAEKGTEASENQVLDMEVYQNLLLDYKKRYIPLIPFIGTLGWFLAWGMNRSFKECNLPYRAHWGVLPRKIGKKLNQMLKDDIPVIISVGPNSPNPSGKYQLALYRRQGPGQYVTVDSVKAHFMVATGLEDDWVRVSSWGKCYYINLHEYHDYVHYHSNWFGSNIMVIKRK